MINECYRFFKYDSELVESLRRVYGSDLEKFFEAIRKPGKRLYVRVNTILANRDYVVESMAKKNIFALKDPILDEAIYFNVEGPFNVPMEKSLVIVDKRTAESVILGANVYVPGVLKILGKAIVNDYVTVVSPMMEPVGWGVLKINPSSIGKLKKGLAVEIKTSRYRTIKIRELEEYKMGLLYEQSLPAMITSVILKPEPGETIVDMCAAPGGKTTHVYQLTRGGAKLYAFDHSKSKINKLKEEIRRLKMRNITVQKADSRYLHIDYPFLKGKVDKIILDPPCSAIGVRPKLYDEKKYSDIINFAGYQFQFFKPAYELLRKNGTLVYSTCTVTLEENENLLEKIVEKYRFDVEKISFRKIGSPGVKEEFKNYVLRFHPHVHDTPGYFIAKLRKF